VTEKTIILPPNPNGNGHEANYRLTMMTPKRQYLSYLRERWWVVLICLALSVGAMVAYETVRPQSYTSLAQIYLSGDVQVNVGSVFSEESLTYFGTQIELLKSAPLQSQAFEAAGITFLTGRKKHLQTGGRSTPENVHIAVAGHRPGSGARPTLPAGAHR
jgi:hypothetical protein